MDVSHTEHSHVIGKGGNNIKRVMEETGCHIHFPDSNRNNQAEKSNQVCDIWYTSRLHYTFLVIYTVTLVYHSPVHTQMPFFGTRVLYSLKQWF